MHNAEHFDEDSKEYLGAVVKLCLERKQLDWSDKYSQFPANGTLNSVI